MPKPLRIGLDPYVHAASFAAEVETALQEVQKEEGWEAPPGVLVTEHPNLVDPLWGDARPAIPTSPFKVHPTKYAGQTVTEKMEAIRAAMATKKATATVFSTLDDVAYALNLRCTGDIDTCPVGIAYCMVTADDIFLYCDERKLKSPEVQEHLKEAGVTVKPYDQIVSDIAAHCSARQQARTRSGWTSRGSFTRSVASFPKPTWSTPRTR